MFEMNVNGTPDHRATVLVVIGLIICLPRLVSLALPAKTPARDETRPRLLWLSRPPGQTSGLYLLEQAGGAEGPGLPAKAGANPPPAYRLGTKGHPEAIDLPAPAAPLFFQPIAINQADLATLATIPGIGPKLAAAIISQRTASGGFRHPDDLRQVKGIGEKKAAMILPHVRF
ncbi:MAG: helix-hairpin-helix domain-containing protein [Desulfobacteraceae bacterium]|nr:helix-hairpin-helix domain-containing protein [Desulfobacteraceae bacterium]